MQYLEPNVFYNVVATRDVKQQPQISKAVAQKCAKITIITAKACLSYHFQTTQYDDTLHVSTHIELDLISG